MGPFATLTLPQRKRKVGIFSVYQQSYIRSFQEVDMHIPMRKVWDNNKITHLLHTATRRMADSLYTRYDKLLSEVQNRSTGLIVVKYNGKLTCFPDTIEKQSSIDIDAKTVKAILSVTPTFCSFLNIDLMNCIIDSTGDAEMKREKSSYIKDLHQFRKDTSFHTFWRMLPKTFPEEPEGFKRLRVEVNWAVSDNLESMENLRQRLSSINPLYQCAMLLRKIKLDPVSIEWLVPTSVEVIFKCLKERQSEFFNKQLVVRCTLNGTSLYEKFGMNY